MITEELKKRFWSRIRTKDINECWEWEGAHCPNGYGQMKIPKSRKLITVTRLSLAIAENLNFLPSPKILCCHKCDNPKCVNPNHLFWGTHYDNQMDSVNKGRSKPGFNKTNQQGESNVNAKLTKKNVEEIRTLLGQNKSNRSIAETFGVTHSTISSIKKNKTWTICV